MDTSVFKEAPFLLQSIAVELPSYEVRQAIGEAVDQSNSPNGDDLRGGFHEEGGLYGKTKNGDIKVVPANPGAVAHFGDDELATVSQRDSKSRADFQSLVQIDGYYHIHPSGSGPYYDKKEGRIMLGGFNQPPSQDDRDFATLQPRAQHLVVGAGDKKVYFYNSNETTATFPLKRFLEIK